MEKRGKSCFVISGRMGEGGRFRPGDWVERLASAVASFGTDRRLRYDARLHPVIIDGEKCLYVSSELERYAPELYSYILSFVKANGLHSDAGGCDRLFA